MDFANETNLRRTFAPYAGQTVILSLASIGSFAVAWEKSVWGLFGAMAVPWGFYAVFVAISLKYRISYGQEYIRRRASGGPDAVIRYDDIESVELGSANASEMVAQSAPYRRIRISDGGDMPINISLRHFRDEDIRRLMAVIHQKRPDLGLPKGFP